MDNAANFLVEHDASLAELADDVAKRRVVCFIGTGVTLSAVQQKLQQIATWPGLLDNGVAHCESRFRVSRKWVRKCKEALETARREDVPAARKMRALLFAASRVAETLSTRRNAFESWLAGSVGQLRADHRDLLQALADLDVLLVTTNYDDLLTSATGRLPVTWKDRAYMHKVLLNERRAILHVHGFWARPDTVVLSKDQYDQVLEDEFTQDSLKALRMMKTLLFVGYGSGTDDPNFKRFFEWSQRVFASPNHSCYKLVRDREIGSMRGPGDGPLRLLSYGDRYTDLPRFIRELKTKRRSTRPAEPKARKGAHSLPPLPQLFGREQIVRKLAHLVVDQTRRPVALRGSPAIGTTSTMVAVLRDEEVADTFGDKRYFVRCDGIRSRDALVAEISRLMGIPEGSSNEQHITALFAKRRAILAFDRLDIPWTHDASNVDAFLENLRDNTRLAIMASIGTEQRLSSLRDGVTVTIQPLSVSPGKALFLHIAGRRFESDPQLAALIAALDGVPLAIELVARSVGGDSNLRRVVRDWRAENAAVLEGKAQAVVPVQLSRSFEFAYRSADLSAQARSLLVKLALLPMGVSEDDLDLLVDAGAAAAAELRSAGLAVEESGRLRLLLPLRFYLRAAHPPSADELEHLVEYLAMLAESMGRAIGRLGGKAALVRLSREIWNFEAVFARLAGKASDARLPNVALHLSDFVEQTGLGSTDLLLRAARLAEGDPSRRARCLVRLGEICIARLRIEESSRHFQEARRLYAQLADDRGSSLTTLHLGDVDLATSDLDRAKQQYDEALALARKARDPFVEGECLLRLGDLDLRQAQYTNARRRYGEAARLYTTASADGGLHRGANVRLRNAVGRAKCLQRLAVIVDRCSNPAAAYRLLRRAFALYEPAGGSVAQADALLGLGDVTLELHKLDEARHWYQAAFDLYSDCGLEAGRAESERRLSAVAFEKGFAKSARSACEHALQTFREAGDVAGQAGCLADLGEIVRAAGNVSQARGYWAEALKLFEAQTDYYWSAMLHEKLAEICQIESERSEHSFKSQKAWLQFESTELRVPERAGLAGVWKTFLERRRNPWLVTVVPGNVSHNRRRRIRMREQASGRLEPAESLH
jgi:tetratricopeptide (TPR) repeat protein